MCKVFIAQTQQELEGILHLRYNILRKPWNQPMESATDNFESTATNAYLTNETKEIIACGRLQENENKIGQIRFMAVDERYRGKKAGKQIVFFLEQIAKTKSLVKIELQSRENAVEFYKSCGYTIKEKSFLLWGQIQHYLMEKNLKD